MNKILKKHKVRRNFLITLFVIVFINVLSLSFWYEIKIKPTLQNIDNIKQIVMNEKLNNNYKSFINLEEDLKNISNEYNINFEIINENNQILKIGKLEKNDMCLFNKFIKIQNNNYVISAYLPNNVRITNLILSLIIFQIIIIVILMIFTYLLAGQSIITPIEKIINDIRNYKFGKKPIRNEINNELDVIQNEFVNLVDSLEEEKQEQKRIIASISHDIKTPLTSIIGYSSLMEDNLTKKELKEYSNKVHDKALHIKDILGTFDDYLANYDNKKLKLSLISIKDIIKQLDDDYKIELNNKNIDFKIKTNCEKEKLNVDILKMKRVFSNIISNSIKFVPKNGKISIDISKQDDYIVFLISDNGKGVEEENINKIFDPFFTTDAGRKISGLGLSICKEFVEIHNGTISAYNDNGFVIKIKLPVYKEKER